MTVSPNTPVSGSSPLTAPPNGAFPPPPTATTEMSLPFGSLSWENFERLCHRLALKDGSFDHVARYGRQGQRQQGIDIFARRPDSRYVVWQAKRYKTYGVNDLRKATKAFLAGNWVDRTDRLIIAVQASVDDTAFQDEVERQTIALAKKSIALEVLGGDLLTERLRPHQDLVFSFFGRNWVVAFYGEQADTQVTAGLDGEEFARVRDQLSRLYMTRFSDLDPGTVASEFTGASGPHRPLPLLDRFTMADVYVRERRLDLTARQSPPPSTGAERERVPESVTPIAREEVRRLSVADWLADGEHIAIIADAGAGKTTLLRAIALDLLTGQTVFESIANRWGERIPLVISFAKWARATAKKGEEVGLKELVASTLQPLLTANLVGLVDRAIDENRVLLIVDGLDEWSNEQAARTALNTLLTYVQVHLVPTIASGRPLGLRKIGSLPQAWKTGQLAPLSSYQQRRLAHAWFHHLQADRPENSAPQVSVSSWQADRFLKELRSDAALGELGETPLLFVGLLFLALRRVALPRNRAEALRSLVTLLLEIHPEARATAAGDVASRFEVALSPALRLDALAAMAFASRRDGGDAGYPRVEARRAIYDYLTQRGGYQANTAEAITDELLAVNAETVGLIIEKGPDEIGFAHASLEEFLSALHVQSWAFADLLDFVSAEAGNPRWKNVLRNLIAVNVRSSEIDDIIRRMEDTPLEPVGQMSRRHLLAEVTFSPSQMRSVTAIRLAEAAFRVVEGPGDAAERADVARLVVNGLSDPILAASVDRQLKRWAPRRMAYTAQVYDAISTWEADDATFEALIAGLNDEDRSGAQAAARALATCFGGQVDRRIQLEQLAGSASSLEVAASAIMALVLGWPEADFDPLLNAALHTGGPLLRATALWARVRLGSKKPEDLDACVRLAGVGSALDYADRYFATDAILTGWPEEGACVKRVLRSFEGYSDREIDRDLAVEYLLRTAPGRSDVKAWILSQLDQDYSFAPGGNWANLLEPFCRAYPDIQEVMVSKILAGKYTHFEHDIWPLIARLNDSRLRDYAIDQVRSQERSSRYWYLLPLLKGWSSDPLVIDLKREVLAIEDSQLDMTVSLLPDLYDTPAMARDRLLQIAKNVPDARFDLIVTALSALGCNGTDNEAVQAILPVANAKPGAFGDPAFFFLVFASHPSVRLAAVQRLGLPDAPLPLLARAFPDEPAIRERTLAVAYSAPSAVRTAIATAAALGGDRHAALYEILECYDDEIDFPLKVQLSIDYHTLRRSEGATEDLVTKLSLDLNKRGIFHGENRAAAFAGLITLGSPEKLLTTKVGEGKIKLDSLIGGGVSVALCTLIIDRWDELKVRLGEDFVERLSTNSGEGKAWLTLAPYIGGSPTARADFFRWCTQSDQIGATGLQALASFWPQSEILLKHIWTMLTSSTHNSHVNNFVAVIIAAGILRDQFGSDEQIARLRKLFLERRDIESAVALSIVRPSDDALQVRKLTALEIGLQHDHWLGAVQIAAKCDSAEVFVSVIRAMAERDVHPGLDGQVAMTSAIIERLSQDSLASAALNKSLGEELSPAAFAASAMALVAAGRLDSAGVELCAEKLRIEYNRTGPPTAVLDILQDQLRSFTHVLLDLVQVRNFM